MQRKDKICGKRRFYAGLKWLSVAMTVVAVLALLTVILYVFAEGGDKISLQLLFGAYETTAPSILPAFVGTLTLILLSCAIAVPLGIASAVFLTEYAKNGPLVRSIRVATETLAGIPSIVYGLFGYIVFVVACGWRYTLLGGGLTLALMILPVIVRSTEESLLSVPVSYREGAYALGAGKVRTIFRIVLPAASGGILTGVILAVGRVISESAVLILTVGMVVNRLPEGIFSPGTSLALDIYFFASHGYPDEAAATAVVLLVFVLLINLLAGLVGKAMKRKVGK